MKNLSGRLESLRKGLTQREFSHNIGIPLTTYTNWIAGISVPKADAVASVCSKLGISIDWLLTGRESVRTNITYGMREMLFEAKGATGLRDQQLAACMGVDPRDVERIMNEGGDTSAAFSEAFKQHLQPLIEERRRGDPVAPRQHRASAYQTRRGWYVTLDGCPLVAA